MAAIAHASDITTDNPSTTNTTYTAVTGAALADTDFVAGGVYLLVVTAKVRSSSANIGVGFRVVHGTTAFAESEQNLEPASAAAGVYSCYGWFTVWTAVASEGITCEHKLNSAGTVNADDIVIFAMRLDADLGAEGTYWHFDEVSADSTQLPVDGTSRTDGATITFTPTAGHDWLVLCYAQHDTATETIGHISRITASGTYTSVVPTARREPENATNDIMQFFLARVYTGLGAVSQNFKQQSSLSNTGAAGDIRLHSSIFALDLNAFRNKGVAYTEAETDLSATDYATAVQTHTITPDVQGDVWSMNWWMYDVDATTTPCENRLQIDDADDPAGQTTDNWQLNPAQDSTDEMPIFGQTLTTSMTAAAHTVDTDGSTGTAAAGRGANYRTSFSITMELPAAGGGTNPKGPLGNPFFGPFGGPV